MKRDIIIMLFVSLTLLFAIDIREESKWQRPDSHLIEKPSDWMAYQRAYPLWQVNPDAYRAEMMKAAALHANNPAKATWTFAGPTNIGGRITDLEMVPGTPPIIYVGAATGGILKSTDNGANWQKLFTETPFVSIGDLAIDPDNPDIIYAGTGEANASSFSFLGGGIYKSFDAGATWTFSGLPNSAYIGRVLVDPENSSRVFAAACGNLFTPNPDRGVYRSLDAGANWTRVLHVTDSTSAIDLVQNPNHPDTLYAAMWERIRGLNYRRSKGYSSGIYRSVDGGSNWSKLSGGLPNIEMGRIGLALAPSNPNVVYAFIDNVDNIMVYRSADAGNTWTACNASPLQGMCSYFGWYFGQVRVDPLDENRVYVMGVDMFRTDDGGQNWNHIAGYFNFYDIHVDHHAMLFEPGTGRILEGNDGGLYQSYDYGNTWTKINNLPITQFYEVEFDHQNPDWIYGGTQDNNSIGTQTGAVDDWMAFLGGDGFYVVVDYTDPYTFYMEYQYGMLHKTTDGGMWMEEIYYDWQGDRTNWSSPLVMHPTDPNTLYFGTYRVWKTTSGGYGWTAVSGDLTKGNDGSAWHTLSTLAISPVNPAIVVAGSDDGKVHISTNSGSTWNDVTAGLPDRYVTRVACDPNNANTIYATLSGFRWDEPYPHVFKSANLGVTWIPISGNLPDLPVNAFVVDPLSGYLAVGTDAGIFGSADNGATWQGISGNIGNIPVTSLKIHNPSRTLLAGTYGLSAWKLDLNTLVSVENASVNESSYFSIWPVPLPKGSICTFALSGNHIRYWTVNIYDVKGRCCKTLRSSPGNNTIQWDGCGYNGIALPTGTYYCHAGNGTEKRVKKLVIL